MKLSLQQIYRAEITRMDLRHDAPRDYLAVIVELDGTEYRRNFEPDATEDRILEDFEKNHATWRIV